MGRTKDLSTPQYTLHHVTIQNHADISCLIIWITEKESHSINLRRNVSNVEERENILAGNSLCYLPVLKDVTVSYRRYACGEKSFAAHLWHQRNVCEQSELSAQLHLGAFRCLFRWHATEQKRSCLSRRKCLPSACRKELESLTTSIKYLKFEERRKKEWMSEWMNEWMNEWADFLRQIRAWRVYSAH